MTTGGVDPNPNEPPKDLVGFLDFYLVKKAPFQLPQPWKEAIVQWGPWIAVVLLIISLPGLLFLLGLGAILTPVGGLGYATSFGYLAIVLLVELGLTVAALPGLFARKMSGWNLLFYAQLVGFVFRLLSLNIIGALVSAVIGFYILFQVRPLYHE